MSDMSDEIVAKLAELLRSDDEDPWDHGWNAALAYVYETLAPVLPTGWEFVAGTDDDRAHLQKAALTPPQHPGS